MTDERAPLQPDGIAFAGRRFQVRLETLPASIGGVRQYELIEAPAAAAVVPVLSDASGEPVVLLVEQDRPAIGGRTLEIPAGVLHTDAAEQPEQTAARELHEETGYRAGDLRRLTSIYPSPGISNEIVHIFLATHLIAAGDEPAPEDSTEITSVRQVPLREAVGMAARGQIVDAKSVIGLLLAGGMLAGASSDVGLTPTTGAGGGTMQMDPTNPPFLRDGGAKDTATPSAGAPDFSLSFETILSQEFNYANTTAYQAMEDRARIFNLYLLLVGVLASALTAVYQLGIKDVLLPLTFLLLLLAGLLGVVFFMLIIRLRQAFRDSVIAMNRIKEYYIQHLIPHAPDAAKAFHWRLRTIPRGERLGSVTYLVTFTIAFLASLCFAGALVVGTQYAEVKMWLGPGFAIPTGTVFLLALLVFVFSVLMHTLYYRRKLSKKADERILKVEEAIIGATAQR